MTAALAILVAGLGTYLSRAVFILALAKRRIPSSVKVAMEYVGPSVMAALVISLLVSPTGAVAIGVAEALALLVGALAAWKTRNHLLSLGLAMLVFWGVRGVMGI